MALSFPLAPADFFGGICVVSSTFFLSPNTVHSGTTGGGEILTASRGARLWTGTATLGATRWRKNRGADTMLSVLEEVGASFFAHPLPRVGPLRDPKGVILGGAMPVIASLTANNKEMALSGLPAGYVLTRGDYLSFSYRSDPVRYALHRIVSAETVANGSGQTPVFEILPHIRPGVIVGAAVQLIRPTFKARLVPDSLSRASSGRNFSDGLSFDFTQTLR